MEKPDDERARAFIEQGYLWNSGNFVFRADVMLDELARFEPEIAAAAVNAVAGAKKDSASWSSIMLPSRGRRRPLSTTR